MACAVALASVDEVTVMIVDRMTNVPLTTTSVATAVVVATVRVDNRYNVSPSIEHGHPGPAKPFGPRRGITVVLTVQSSAPDRKLAPGTRELIGIPLINDDPDRFSGGRTVTVG